MCAIDPPASINLPADAHAPSQAREFLRRVRCEHGVDPVGRLDSAQLLVSELVTNAVRYGAPPLVLAVECEQGLGLQVRVSDSETSPPVPREAGDCEESGRGMTLVEVISDAWGVEPAPSGKTVWFLLR